MPTGGRRGTHVQLKHIKTVRKKLKNGEVRTYYYHRLANKRLKGEPGSAEFLASYAEAEKPFSRHEEGTLDRLIDDYMASPEFARLAAYTRADYQRQLVKIRDRFAQMPVAALDSPRIKGDFLRFRNELADASPRQADYMFSVARRLVKWAIDYGYLSYNHLTNPGKLYTNTRADKRWTPERIDEFMRSARLEFRQALMLALHTGQRQGDLRDLRWADYDGALITLVQSKTKVRVSIPCSTALGVELDRWERRSDFILTTPTGLRWTRDNFSSQWRLAMHAAGISGLTFNDLRGTFITLLSESGCTPQEISAISGHNLEGKEHILDTYSDRTLELARTAIGRFEACWAAKVTTEVTTG